jgi:urease accessory protein UreE
MTKRIYRPSPKERARLSKSMLQCMEKRRSNQRKLLAHGRKVKITLPRLRCLEDDAPEAG